MILAEKIERKVNVNQEDFVSHIQPPSWHSLFVIQKLVVCNTKARCLYNTKARCL